MFLELLDQVYFNNALLLWLYALGILIGAIVISQVILFFTKNVLSKITSKTKSDIDDVLVDLAEEPFAFLIVIAGFFIGYQFLAFPQDINTIFYNAIRVAIMLDIIWFVVRFVDSFFERIVAPVTKKSKTKLDDHIVPWLKKAIKVALVFIGIIVVLDNMGIDVWALLAGLGIGGLAFAFAAQKTIADAFGGISILFSRPFIVGDVINFSSGAYVGVVEDISLRHTKVRNFDKQLIIVPNSILASEIVVNVTTAPKKKVVWTIGVTYNTSNKKLEDAKKIIKKAIKDCKLCDDDFIVAFQGFGASSLDIFVVFYTKTSSFTDMVEARDQVGTQVKREFDKAKISFAFPTQTIHLEK